MVDTMSGYGPGHKEGSDAPSRMGYWAEGVDQTEESAQTTESEPTDAIDRREFLGRAAKWGIGLAAIATLGYVGEQEANQEQAKHDEKIKGIIDASRKVDVTMQPGDTLWGYFKQSGWDTGEIDSTDYMDALLRVNPGKNFMKIEALDAITFLYRK